MEGRGGIEGVHRIAYLEEIANSLALIPLFYLWANKAQKYLMIFLRWRVSVHKPSSKEFAWSEPAVAYKILTTSMEGIWSLVRKNLTVGTVLKILPAFY